MTRDHYADIEEQEAKFIRDHFKGAPPGRFLDIGTQDAEGVLSKTALLRWQGWTGVYVEPSPAAFEKIRQRFGRREQFVLVNAAITPDGGPMWFYDDGGCGLSSLVVEHMEAFRDKHQVQFSKYLVSTLSVAQLLSYVGTDFRFVNIDCEGASVPVLRALPLLAMPVEMGCVEFEGDPSDVVSYLQGVGFHDFQVTELDVIFWKRLPPYPSMEERHEQEDSLVGSA